MNKAIRNQIIGKYVLSPKAREVARNLKVRKELQEATGLGDLAILDNLRRNTSKLTEYGALEVLLAMSDLKPDELLVLSKSEPASKEKIVVKDLFG